MPKKKGLSLNEHQELGLKLQRLSKELGEIYFQLQNGYGQSSYPCKNLDAAILNVSAVQCELDNFVLNESQQATPFEKEIALNCYYPSLESVPQLYLLQNYQE